MPNAFGKDTLAVFDEGESDPAWKVTITHWTLGPSRSGGRPWDRPM